MEPAQFEDGPGEIVPYNGIPCFNPTGLPPEFTITTAILDAHGTAMRSLGRLSTLHNHIGNENLLLAPFAVREAAMSSQIEGTSVTVSDIVLHEPDTEPDQSATTDRDIREAYNYVDAISTGFDHLREGGSIDRELICQLHESLLVDVRGESKKPGEIRNTPVIIGPTTDPKDAQFIPSNPNHVSLLLDQLLAYNRMDNYPALIDIILSHYQFETIHPFRDGNGRLGRLLIMLQLHEAELLEEPYLYLSSYFNRNRNDYFSLLNRVSREGAWEDWILFGLRAIEQQARDAYDCGRELIALREAYQETYDQSPAVRDVITHLFEEPYLKPTRAIEATDRPSQTIYKVLDRLESDGVIREITGKKRGKVYRAPEILAIVERP